MFADWYQFRYINRQMAFNEYPFIATYCYSFKKTSNQRRYVVQLHEYEYKVFVIKFYEAAHKNRRNKFNMLFNDHDCTKILRTVIEVALDILKSQELASFAFVGVPKEGKEGKDKENNQRLRIYKQLAENFFGTDTFKHGHEYRVNCYLMVTKKNINPETLYETIIDMFAGTFIELDDLLL